MKKIVILMGLLGFLAACDEPVGGSSTMVSPEASSNKL